MYLLSKRKKIIIINKTPFGYHTDTYKYAQYLNEYYLKYICFDTGREKYDDNGIDVIYSKWRGRKISDAFLFFVTIYKELRKCKAGTIVFIHNFQFCFLTTFFNRKSNYILDIRSLSVSNNKLKKKWQDGLIRVNTFFFDKISVVSEGIARQVAGMKLSRISTTRKSRVFI
jgi:hypothetical protein